MYWLESIVAFLYSGCVIHDCVFSSVYFSEREMSYLESHPVITHLRDTKAKKTEREITRGARLLHEGLQAEQLSVSGVSLSAERKHLHKSAVSFSQSQGQFFCYCTSRTVENFKNKKHHKACDTCRYCMNIALVT